MNPYPTTKPIPRPALTWFPANLDSINRRFTSMSPETLLRWGAVTFGQDVVLSTGLGPSGIVLMHMVSQLRLKIPVFYLQTDLFFPETLALRDELTRRLGLELIEVHSGLSLDEQARQFGPELWRHDPDLCCRLRKVNSIRQFLAGKKAWISGIRRDQSTTRAQTQPIAWDNTNHLLKLSPLANWTREEVWNYLYQYDLPYNLLHDDGYPSIGCMPCTSKADNSDERAGRWAGMAKTECGIHVQDGKVVRLKQQAGGVGY